MGSKGVPAKGCSRASVRSSIAALGAMSLVYAGDVALMEATVSGLEGVAVSTASVVSMLVTFALIAALIACEVRAYRAVVASVPFEPEMGDKILLGLSLWFAGGVPLALTNLVRAVALGGAADVRQILIELGAAAALVVLTYPRFRA